MGRGKEGVIARKTPAAADGDSPAPFLVRRRHLDALGRLLEQFPVVGLLGARQVGKTTLARDYAAECGQPVTFFDLEDAGDLARHTFPLAERVRALSLSRLYQDLEPLH